MHCSIRYYSDFLLILARKQRQFIHGGGYIVKEGESYKKEEFKTKICGCQYFVVVLLCYNHIFQIELVLINGLKNMLTKNGGDIQI